MKQSLAHLTRSVIQFFYPSFCLHCNDQTFGEDKWICKPCFEQIEWIDPRLTCQTCGKPKRGSHSLHCNTCRINPSYLMPFASCFSPEGPAYKLHEYMRVYESEEIAKIFASLLVIKLQKLSWPFPNAIIPVPHSRLETLSLKRQPNYLLAKNLSKMLVAPFKPILTTHEKGKTFSYKAKKIFHQNLRDQKVLLISDRVRDSNSLKLAREATLALFPKTIYTLSLFDHRT